MRGRGVAQVSIDVDGTTPCSACSPANVSRIPALVTVSQSGMIVRLRSATQVKTLTASSGPALARALHPGLGLLAIQHDEESVEIRQLETGDIVVTVHAQ